MLSPHTPPGTEVVQYQQGKFPLGTRTRFPPMGTPLVVDTIKPFGEVHAYTTLDPRDAYLVKPVGYDCWISCALLRRLHLPRCLTSLLNTKKIKEDV